MCWDACHIIETSTVHLRYRNSEHLITSTGNAFSELKYLEDFSPKEIHLLPWAGFIFFNDQKNAQEGSGSGSVVN